MKNNHFVGIADWLGLVIKDFPMIENKNSAASVQPQRSFSLRSILTAVMFLFLPPLLLFGAAGTINWPMGWVYIALTLGGVILSRVLVTRIHPDLLSERATSRDAANVPTWDKKIAPLISTVIPMVTHVGCRTGQAFWLDAADGHLVHSGEERC